MVNPIAAADEELHPPGAAPHWQESYYFNWVDVDGDAMGFARLGYRFAQRQADAVVVTMRGGRREFVYGAVDQPIDGDPLALRCADGLTVGRLTFRLEDPLRQWRITLSGRDYIDLTWTALAPAFDFGHNGTEVIAHRHFEHPGTVAGRSRIRGFEHQIAGFGTRDKSWGPRDWANVTGWDWISAQFGDELAFTVTQTTTDGQPVQSGFVSRRGRTHAVTSFDLRYVSSGEHSARDAELSIVDDEGATIYVSACGIAQVPLFKSGLMLHETHARFDARLEDGSHLPGAGVIEHTWHAGPREQLRRLPRLLPVAKDAVVSRFR
ncbi:MAG: DUF7065 domain-containing protein [Mycobacterium sp.]